MMKYGAILYVARHHDTIWWHTVWFDKIEFPITRNVVLYSDAPHQGWAKIKSWFDLIWMDFWTFWFDLIWHMFLIAWFDLIWRRFSITWFDLIWFDDLFPMIWFDLNLQNHYRPIFWFETWIQAKPMAPMERARWELSIGAIFVYETWILIWL